jgi:hypothetical protein
MDAHLPLPAQIWEHIPAVAQELIVAQAMALAQQWAAVTPLKAMVECSIGLSVLWLEPCTQPAT